MSTMVPAPPVPDGCSSVATTHPSTRLVAASLHADLFELANGQHVHIRSVCAEDKPALGRFHAGLSPQSVYCRYFNSVSLSQRADHTRLQRNCTDQDGAQTALVAVCFAGRQEGDIVGVGRLSRSPVGLNAEFAFIVSDDFQDFGLGSELMRRLIVTARTAGLREMIGYILRGNRSMLGVCRKFGFRVRWDMEMEALCAELDLR